VVLEIGTGSGYQAAVLSPLCKRVHSLERWPLLAATAADRLRAAGCDNVEVHCADGNLGWPAAAPFDGIVVTCAAPEIPPLLLQQLAPHGRMVLPLGQPAELQQLALVTRDRTGKVHRRDVLSVRFVPMVAGVAPPDGLRWC
jgi:protein-L-isoaspartate(D-aspartate) O-methyltransferase